MVLAKDRALCLEAKRFSDRGKPFESSEPTNLFLGLNYRMTELEAAVGRVQLTKVRDFAARRQSLAKRLFKGMAGLKAVRPPALLSGGDPSYWVLRLRIDVDALNVDKERFAAAARAEGLPGKGTYTAIIYEQKWFREQRTFGRSGLPWTSPAYGRNMNYAHCCPNSERAMAGHMIVAWSETYSENEVDGFAAALEKVERAYRR